MRTYQKLILIALQMTALFSFTSHAENFDCSSTYFNARLINELEGGKTENLVYCKSGELDALEKQLRDSADNDYNRMNAQDAQLNTERMRNYRLQRLIDTVSLDRVRAYRSAHNL